MYVGACERFSSKMDDELSFPGRQIPTSLFDDLGMTLSNQLSPELLTAPFFKAESQQDSKLIVL